ncbi:O-antigen ligase family protein [Komagataeibacter kakiaceti]|uniref:O-antigen ligase family protein n=1 Tax=Komagataeibacter kakiaceti TaxID=943261 RepID=UPI000471460A|nr:O-antigen ligase family protein [Komagataeibacter kakiaceti]
MAEQADSILGKNIQQTDWVSRLSTILLCAMMLFSIVSVPDFNRTASVAASTDHVNPINRFVWLGLLSMALPLIRARWAQILRLIKASWLLIGLFLYFTCSTVWALDPAISTRRIMFAWIEIILAVTLTCTMKDRKYLLKFIFISCLVAAVADLIVWILMPGYAMTSEGLAGIQSQKNQTGLIMMYGLLAGAPLLLYRPPKRERYRILAGMGLLFLLLLASRSKTCLGIIMVMPVLVVLFFKLTHSRMSLSVAIVTSISAIFICIVFGYFIWCEITNVSPFALFQDMTFTSRTDLWSFMFQEIQKRPWFGAGFYSFWSIDPSVQPSLKTSMWFGSEAHINEAHDGYLDLLATGGAVGFIWGLSVIIRTFTLALEALGRAGRPDPARPTVLSYPLACFHVSFLCALCIHNFTESNLFCNNGMLAVALYFTIFDLEDWEENDDQPLSQSGLA